MNFKITNLKIEQQQHDQYEGYVLDPDWSWTAPNGKVVKWINGTLENATEKQSFVGVDEDGDDIIDYFWEVDGVRVPDRSHIQVPCYVESVSVITGEYEVRGGKYPEPPAMCIRHKAQFEGLLVEGIIITSIHCSEFVTHGTFIAEKVTPCD